MAIKDIVQFPDPRLRQKSHKVRSERKEYIASLVEDLKDTAEANNAAGLSAIQIGVPLRVIVVNVGNRYFHAINPEITVAAGQEEADEMCLSIPGLYAPVKRATKVKVKSVGGNATFLGHTARIIQHEIDHLNGILIIDRAEITV